MLDTELLRALAISMPESGRGELIGLAVPGSATQALIRATWLEAFEDRDPVRIAPPAFAGLEDSLAQTAWRDRALDALISLAL